MFQSQIYQKWGLRKTKPGEAKKEAKEAKGRKRPRLGSEDVESVASSSQSQPMEGALPTADNFSSSGKSYHSVSPPDVGSDVARFAPPVFDDHTGSSEKGDGSQAVDDHDDSVSISTAVHSRPPVPQGWSEFLGRGTVTIPEDSEVVVPNDSASWISTVLHPTPPGSVTYSDRRIPAYSGSSYSSRSRSSGSSKRSRSSHASRETASVSGDSKRARTLAAFARPMGSIHVLESPKSLLLPEKSMFFARHFISSIFSTGIWALSQSADPAAFDSECFRLEQWFNDFNPAFEFLREQKVKRAFRHLKRCFANTKVIIEPQDPRVVIYLCQQAIRCMFYDTIGRGLAKTLLKYITGLCQVLFGAEHPLYIMMEQLSRMDSFEFADNIRPFMDCYFDHLEPFLVDQPTNVFGHITEMRGLTISLMEGIGMLGIYEAKPIMETLVRRAEDNNLPSLHLKLELASILQRNRFFSEALTMLAEVRSSEEAIANPYELMYAGIILLLTYRKMRNFDGAIETGYELVEYLDRPIRSHPGYGDGTNMSLSLMQYQGSRDSSRLVVLGKLERDLRDAGRLEEAATIQARMDAGIAQELGPEDAEDGDPIVDVDTIIA